MSLNNFPSHFAAFWTTSKNQLYLIELKIYINERGISDQGVTKGVWNSSSRVLLGYNHVITESWPVLIQNPESVQSEIETSQKSNTFTNKLWTRSNLEYHNPPAAAPPPAPCRQVQCPPQSRLPTTSRTLHGNKQVAERLSSLEVMASAAVMTGGSANKLTGVPVFTFQTKPNVLWFKWGNSTDRHPSPLYRVHRRHPVSNVI